MTKNTGQPSQVLFEALFLPFGKRAFLHRITDTAEVRGMNKKAAIVKAQPSDYLVTLDGEMYYAEVKSTVGDHFKRSCLRPGQIAAARKQLAAGGFYFVYVHAIEIAQWFRIPADFILNSVKASWAWHELKGFRL